MCLGGTCAALSWSLGRRCRGGIRRPGKGLVLWVCLGCVPKGDIPLLDLGWVIFGGKWIEKLESGQAGCIVVIVVHLRIHPTPHHLATLSSAKTHAPSLSTSSRLASFQYCAGLINVAYCIGSTYVLYLLPGYLLSLLGTQEASSTRFNVPHLACQNSNNSFLTYRRVLPI